MSAREIRGLKTGFITGKSGYWAPPTSSTALSRSRARAAKQEGIKKPAPKRTGKKAQPKEPKEDIKTQNQPTSPISTAQPTFKPFDFSFSTTQNAAPQPSTFSWTPNFNFTFAKAPPFSWPSASVATPLTGLDFGSLRTPLFEGLDVTPPPITPFGLSTNGEEGEITKFQTEVKLYELLHKKWNLACTGLLKIQKHKETGVGRFLLRSPSGLPVLNMVILGATPIQKQGDKSFLFIGTNYDSNNPTGTQMSTFSVKTKTEIALAGLISAVHECQHER